MAAQEEFNNQHEFTREDKSEQDFVKNEPMSGDEHEDGSTSEDKNESSEIDINYHPQLKRIKCDDNEFTYEENPDPGFVLVKNELVFNDEQDGGSEDENENIDGENDSNCTEIKRIQCEFCNKEFSRSSNLKIHFQLHSVELKLKEQNGDLSVDENESIKRESDSNTHLKIKLFKCELCNKDFSTNCNLTQHLKLHSGETICDEQNGTENDNEIADGVNGSNKEIKRFQCKFCNKVFSRKSNLKRHLKLHSGVINGQGDSSSESDSDESVLNGSKIKQFQCEFCDKSFSRNCNLKRHLKQHSGEINDQNDSSSENDNERIVAGSKIKQFQCEFCDKSFSKNINLKRHLKLHSGEINDQNDSSSESVVSGSKIKQFQCEFCDKSFSKNSNLKRHLKLHSGQNDSWSSGNESVERKRFRCKFCKKNFSKNCYLKSHLIIHSDVKNFICTICNREFSRKDSLEKHFKTHTGDKQYSCRVCNKQFIQKGNLRRHERIHSGIKEYKCLICNKEFLEQRSLKKHAEIHYKEFKCTKCNKEFLRQEDFTKHLKFNSGVKECNQFECTVCQKQFVTNKKLKSHMKIHSVHKEYKCTICNRQFTYKHYLVKHMRTHSYVKDFQCAICIRQFSHKSSLRRHLEHHRNELKNKEMTPQDMNVKQQFEDREEINEDVDACEVVTCESKNNREFVFVKCEQASSDENGGD